MSEFIIDAILKSDAVAIVQALESGLVDTDDGRYLRVTGRVTEVLAGQLVPGGRIVIDIVFENKETPRVQPDREYLVFLRSQDPQRWRLLDSSRPVAVGAEERVRVVAVARRAAQVAASRPSPDQLKAHYLEMLRTGVRLFVTDAARATATIASWNDADLEQMAAMLAGSQGPPPEGNTRDFLAAAIVRRGSPPLATRFAREELQRGNADAVYFGLLERDAAEAGAIVGDLLRDQGRDVKSGALRVAGLLRRDDLLDRFEKEQAPGDAWFREPLTQARALVRRD